MGAIDVVAEMKRGTRPPLTPGAVTQQRGWGWARKMFVVGLSSRAAGFRPGGMRLRQCSMHWEGPYALGGLCIIGRLGAAIQ